MARPEESPEPAPRQTSGRGREDPPSTREWRPSGMPSPGRRLSTWTYRPVAMGRPEHEAPRGEPLGSAEDSSESPGDAPGTRTSRVEDAAPAAAETAARCEQTAPTSPSPAPPAISPSSERAGPLSVAPPKPAKATSSQPPVAPAPSPKRPSVPEPPRPPRLAAPSEKGAVPRVGVSAAPRGHRMDRRVGAALLAGAIVAGLLLWFWPRSGLLTITAFAPGVRTIGAVEIAVDGQLRCERAPCTVAGLGRGEHAIHISGAGYFPADRIVVMRPGLDHSVDVWLERPSPVLAPAPAAPASALTAPSASDRLALERPPARASQPTTPGTGTIKANSFPVSKVLVDGRSAGETPASIQVVPGPHTVSYVHADYGRRDGMVEVKARQDAVVAVKFHPGKGTARQTVPSGPSAGAPSKKP